MANHEPDTVFRLFEQEVPEIAAGIVQIKAIARKPGVRCTVAVHSEDPKVRLHWCLRGQPRFSDQKDR
jgi:transcription antitermination factor NusA-like protein